MADANDEDALTWPALAEAWRSAPRWDPERKKVLAAATRHARKDPNAFWRWFLTLDAEARKNGSLVANVLSSWRGRAPVPKRAFLAMLRAGVEERDPSFNRTFKRVSAVGAVHVIA